MKIKMTLRLHVDNN